MLLAGTVPAGPSGYYGLVTFEAFDLDAVYARSDRIVARRIADEFLLVPLVGRGASLDAIFSLNRTGAFIWERLDGIASGHDLVSAIVDRFDVSVEQASADYRDFAASLLAVGAIALRSPSG